MADLRAGKRPPEQVATQPKPQMNVASVQASQVYTVKSGETLSEIAVKNKTTVAALQKLNNIKNVNMIRAGQKIRLK
ncbi:LysM repeat protein [Anoxybacillus calidus]|uniref:LysM repeat protein n=1 Tax=[Anoxybacillus] calidus TaxID=575178 RepID=A0A7W0BXJ8_9BACL|nr:LysM repeat protein [Anoxybacillus calidus]